jgi:two-component system, sporulation sensor kinase D
MNLYSNKQRWKIALLLVALLMIGASLFVSNEIVFKVQEREKERITQWGDAIRKKAALVNLTNHTFDELRDKERQKVKMWAKATRELAKPTLDYDMMMDYTFLLEIIQGNDDIPVILLDKNNKIISHINLPFEKEEFDNSFSDLSPTELKQKFNDSLVHLTSNWSLTHEPIEIEVYRGVKQYFYYFDSKKLGKLEQQRDSLILAFNHELIEDKTLVPVVFIDKTNRSILETNIDSLQQFIGQPIPNEKDVVKHAADSLEINFQQYQSGVVYFDESQELKLLKYYPYLQFLMIGLFILIGYLVFSTFRKAEQNKVWAGMAKETAHQLGTPLSSLMAWIQILESKGIPQEDLVEMNKDVDRLTIIADRFSKIGSGAKLTDNDIIQTIQHVTQYLRPRISSKIDFQLIHEEPKLIIPHNPPLLEWVIENICKNAVDAMEGDGKLTVHIEKGIHNVHIDITDTGKGISPKLQKRIFEPGFTTKTRGWGLGLSLVKRIIHTYHNGKVVVLCSEIGKGSTFRITLPLK